MHMRVKSQDKIIQSHQPTARRLTWEDERVPAPGLNLKIDGDQSFQTTAGKWAESKAKEFNSLIQLSAISPIHDGPMQGERNKSSRHINHRFHVIRNNFKVANFFTKQLPTPRTIRTSSSQLIRIEIKYLWTINPKILQVKANSAEKRKYKPMSNTL
jgi:hypothetical protein